MHRTQGEDFDPDLYDDATNKRGFKPANPPSSNATRLSAESMNAIQEELSNLVELCGLTLNTSSASDRAAGWHQIYDAIFKSKKIDDDSVKDGSLTGTQIADGSIPFAKLSDDGRVLSPLYFAQLNPGQTHPILQLSYYNTHFIIGNLGDDDVLMIAPNAITGDQLYYDTRAFASAQDGMVQLREIRQANLSSAKLTQSVSGTEVKALGPPINIQAANGASSVIYSVKTNITAYLFTIDLSGELLPQILVKYSYKIDNYTTGYDTITFRGQSLATNGLAIGYDVVITPAMIGLLTNRFVYNIYQVQPQVQISSSGQTVDAICSATVEQWLLNN